MNAEFDQSNREDTTTPLDENLVPGSTEEMPLPAWASELGPVSDAQVTGATWPLTGPPPPPGSNRPVPPDPSGPVSPPSAPSGIEARVPPPSGPPSAGPRTPNYSAAPIPPVAAESLASKSFAPSAPPNPPDGDGQRPGVRAKLSRWGWRSLIAFLAGGLIAAAGFAAGELNDGEVAAAGPTPTSIVVRQVDPADSLIVNVDEPAALVADVLGPSVVQIETDFGLGSGVIYRDGFILTNNHVVNGAERLRVRLSTGENFDAELVGTDESKDLAVLSVGNGRNLPVADLALGVEVQVGQIAIAIGSPFQLQQTVTAGIVSAVDRPIPSRTNGVYVAMIQTDAPINPGNSGGALADKNGRVIGINTAIQTDGFSGTNAGVGFAIPIEDAVRIADLMVAGDPIEPGYLGVAGGPPDSGEAGVEIVEVTSGSAAEAAGLEPGDRVLSLDGAPVTSIQELAGLVLAHQAGDQVILEVVRQDQEFEFEATLGVRE